MEKTKVYRPRSLAYLLCVMLLILLTAGAAYLLYLGIAETNVYYIITAAAVIIISLRYIIVLLSYNLKIGDTFIAAYKKRVPYGLEGGAALSARKTRRICEKILFKDVKNIKLECVKQKNRFAVFFVFYFENHKQKRIDTGFYGKKQTLILKDLIKNKIMANSAIE